MPKEADSFRELARALGVLMGRDRIKAAIERVAHDAGIDLPAAACVALVRIDEDDTVDLGEIERLRALPAGVLTDGEALLRERGYLESGTRALTADGEAVLARYVEARRRRICDLLDGWTPEEHDKLADLLRTLARQPELSAAAG
jgi:hypothetical protein